MRATGATEEIAVRSIRAGNDIVLTTGQGSWIRTYRALLAEARSSRAFRAQVRASAHRVLMLQEHAPLAHPSTPKGRLKQASRPNLRFRLGG